MQTLIKRMVSGRLVNMLFITLVLFVLGTGTSLAYGGHAGGGYYQGHIGVHAHYRSHGDIGTGGYIILGLIGAVLLVNILDSLNHNYQGSYYRSNSYLPSPPPRPVNYAINRKPVSHYRESDGWNSLANGDSRHAMDIFAIQSQQQLESGIPRIGFSLAAAANGEPVRGAKAMQKAIRIDPGSINQIKIDDNLLTIINLIINDLTSDSTNNSINTDTPFMLATLYYLKHDYSASQSILDNIEETDSTHNLQILISEINIDRS